ncbi:branched-chain amino acid ABC transporter permease [Mycolicibacterium agri]|uniref:Branched-chain amino acid ABC transporter permease n=1 Tax=Mycolicibacterium agri TaxID=36811 RepID=A0A2A7MQJ8_MYCAG|nr:branched-chain amino acid ABC transporter permease [Mycolicibacterium agri]PEG33839.1 branched-chain amino acid ABC transporter permease [Mycolicibacterium agri]GFG52843.1 branched-chain amino acid ABC transporter permease [Mycolicibacterium agri]
MNILLDALRTAVGPTCAAYALGALGLNLQFGYAGLINLGFAGSLATGAYGLAITVSLGGGFWLGILVAVVASCAFSMLVALPTVRLRADYLAMTTIAAAEILRLVLRSSWAAPVTGGVYGKQRFANDFYALNPLPAAKYALGPVIVSGRTLWLMIVAWSLVALAAIALRFIVRSPWGRVVTAIREDEVLATSFGKNAFAVKVQVMVLGGVLGALAGVVLAVDQQNVNPDSFGAATTFLFFAIVILGGRARASTPITGAIVFWLILSATDGVLRQAADLSAAAGGWFGQEQAGAARYILVGLALMLVVVFRPQGFLVSRRVPNRVAEVTA